ncbi:MAG TPA: squalene--hopene cyclase [Bryobacteraceae bacterium]|nr:squalene--hopene cyclase [Bryobacteraceae bacterium]
MSPSLQLADGLAAACATAQRRAAEYLLGLQHPEGYWWADLTADTTLESDFILLELWRHPPQNGVWNPPTRPLIDKAVRSILARQLPDGGFNIYAQGPSEISATVKAYTALKLSGVAMDDPDLMRARDRILALGGLQAANSYVKVNLSLFGLYPREHAPFIPPEFMLLGDFIYQMSSWTRAIVIPLSIVHAMNPRRPVPAGFNLNELIAPGVSFEFPNNEGFFSWRNFFLKADRFLKFLERRMWRGRLRTKAIRRAEQWMLERTRYTDGVAAIYPPMMYVIMALDLLGYPKDHPDVKEAEKQFFNLLVDDERGFYFQPCFSVVWDTAIAAYALGESGVVPEHALTRCADWLLTKEVRRKGDWAKKRPNVEPSGWYFEFANEFYPDIDDTGQVLLALSHARASSGHDACVRRAVDWLLAMQSSDGGWAAFDVDNNWHSLSAVPFADHNAMLDPTCPDITGRVLEGLIASGVKQDHPAIERGVAYLIKAQETDGSWYGRWGVDYIYGSFLALRGLQAAGVSDREAYILRAGEWLRSIQNADGGWGESCESYDRNTFVAAQSTPSQTAWAILGLLAGGDTTSSSLHKGIEYLIETQRRDGGWDEELSTGTGFPGVFYLKYHYYRHSFPVLALSTYLKTRSAVR